MTKQYTQEELKPMGDQEINIAVAEKLGFEIYRKTDDTVWLSEYDLVDYNNPNDIMPLVEKYKISHIPCFNKWLAFKGTLEQLEKEEAIESTNQNLYRAYCEVFLMMEIDDE